jgi:hypothetical protein
VTARRDSQVAKGERALADSLTRRFERALSDSLSRMMTALRDGRRVDVRGFDPKEMERLRDLARAGAAVPNVPRASVPGVVGGPSPAPAPGSPNTTVYRVVPPVADAPPVPLPGSGVRRVLLGAPRFTRREFAGIGIAIADSIRRAIAGTPGYDVVDAASLTDPRFYGSRSRTSLARAVGAGAVLTGLYFPRPDSLFSSSCLMCSAIASRACWRASRST